MHAYMYVCIHVFLCMYTYICRGELYACDKVINGLLFMLFNAYIIINVSCRWLRSHIIILWLKGHDRWHCICYKDICVKRYNQPPVVISGGWYPIMINLVLVVCFQSVIHLFLCVIRKSLINNLVRQCLIYITEGTTGPQLVIFSCNDDVISFSVYNALWLECILLYMYQFLNKKYLKDTMQFVLYTFKYM